MSPVSASTSMLAGRKNWARSEFRGRPSRVPSEESYTPDSPIWSRSLLPSLEYFCTTPVPAATIHHVLVVVDVAIMKPVPQPVRISPGTDDISIGIELDHRRRQARRIEIFGNHILPIEDEHVIPAVDAHPAQTARDPSVG